MKQIYLLLCGLLLLCQQVSSQNVVRVQQYDVPPNTSGYVFARNNFFLNRGSFFDVLNLETGISRQITKPSLPYMRPGFTLGPVGSSILFAGTHELGAFMGSSMGFREFDTSIVLRQIVPGTNSTFALYTLDREGYKLIEIDHATQKPDKFWITGKDAEINMSYSAREDVLFFSNKTPANTIILYASDGTTAGTTQLQEIQVNPDNYSYTFFVNNGDVVHFVYHTYDRLNPARSFSHVYRLTPNTATAAGVYPDLTSDPGQYYFKDKAMYTYSRQSHSFIKAEGETKTSLLPPTKYPVSIIGELNDKLLLVTLDSSATDGWATALYETDGTAIGTRAISDITYQYSENKNTFIHKGALYFTRYNAQTGDELYKYDGRKVSLVADVIPGKVGLEEVSFYTYKEELYFTARPSDNSQRLHVYLVSDHAATVQLSAYADLNENQVKDANEPYLDNQLFSLNEGALTVLTNQDVAYVLLQQGTYTLSLKPGKGWRATENTGITIELPEDKGRHYSFALVPEQVVTQVEASLMSDATRCGFPTPYTLHYRNSGFTPASGTIKLKPEGKFTFDSASPAPDRISGDTLIWQLHDLKIGKKGTIRLNFTMPGVEHMGDTLVSELFTSFRSLSNQTTYADTTRLQQILTCSYDPNDIQVNPAGLGEKHLTLKQQELEYLIRFQNMGTDKAFNIVVENTLQEALDLSSFHVLGSSHAMYTVIKGNKVSFHFDNIQLPDDKVDEPGSHGYILYRIKPKSGLSDSTVVHNQAFIYFDYNPAIETNITYNTLVDKMPVANSKTVLGVKEELENSFAVYPNPAHERLYIQWQAERPYGTTITLLNSLGQQVNPQVQDLQDATVLYLSGLPKGLYFLKVTHKNSSTVKRIVVQ